MSAPRGTINAVLRAAEETVHVRHWLFRAASSCAGVSVHAGTPHPREEVNLYPVYEQEGPNKEWASATPAGSLNLTIDNPGAQGTFQDGKEYFVDISPAQ